jgi:hypothetical protein
VLRILIACLWSTTLPSPDQVYEISDQPQELPDPFRDLLERVREFPIPGLVRELPDPARKTSLRAGPGP